MKRNLLTLKKKRKLCKERFKKLRNWKTRTTKIESQNRITKSKKSSDASCKDQTNHWKGRWQSYFFGRKNLYIQSWSGQYNDISTYFSGMTTAWKVSEYGVSSHPYFKCIWTEYRENLRIQSEYRKIWTRRNHAVYYSTIVSLLQTPLGEALLHLHQKMKKPWKKWLNMLVGALRKLARKSFESLPAIVRALLVLY